MSERERLYEWRRHARWDVVQEPCAYRQHENSFEIVHLYEEMKLIGRMDYWQILDATCRYVRLLYFPVAGTLEAKP